MGTILKKFQEAGLGGLMQFMVLGALLWGGVLASYITSAVYSSEWQQGVWILVIVLHVIEGALVTVEAIKFQGETWWFSTLVIGNAVTILFFALVLHIQQVVVYLLENPDTSPYLHDAHTIASGISIALGIYASSMMVAELWSYFHKKIGKHSELTEEVVSEQSEIEARAEPMAKRFRLKAI